MKKHRTAKFMAYLTLAIILLAMAWAVTVEPIGGAMADRTDWRAMAHEGAGRNK